ncbi:MAG: methyltransferase domain-containing protein [Armatimonadetes bacterium]|nr:methyltransferase domain-containing protein [Armatimonadota bacterium]
MRHLDSVPAPRPREAPSALPEQECRHQCAAPSHGLSTDLQEHSGTADGILPHRLDGKTVLDVGCASGYFCCEAYRRGAARVVGIDSDEGCLRQARITAQCLGLPIEFQHREIEREELPDTFDTVLCRNALHRVHRPRAMLDRLIRSTRERLVLEIPAAEHSRTRGVMRPTGILRQWLGLSIRRLLAATVGYGSHSEPDELLHLHVDALKYLLNQRGDIARVDVLPSSRPGRQVAVAWKRQMNYLAFVAGLPAAGKTTLIERLQKGDLPEIRAALGLDCAPRWVHTEAMLLKGLTEPHVPAMIFHYGLLRGSPLEKRRFAQDEALHILGCARRTRALMLWVDPHVLIERMKARLACTQARDLAKQREARIRFYQDPHQMSALLRQWFAFCRAQGLHLQYADTTAEPRLMSEPEYFERVRAAGWGGELPGSAR